MSQFVNTRRRSKNRKEIDQNKTSTMGTDNGQQQEGPFCNRTLSVCKHSVSFARVGLMTTLLVVFIVFASMSGNGKESHNTTELRSGQSHIKTTNINNEPQYHNYEWKDLPRPVQNSASRLGYTRRSWDHSNYTPPIFNKQWTQLMAEEKKAASDLGYSKKSWCNDDEVSTTAPTSEGTSEGTTEGTSEGTTEGTSEGTTEGTSEETDEDDEE